MCIKNKSNLINIYKYIHNFFLKNILLNINNNIKGVFIYIFIEKINRFIVENY